MIQEIVAFGGFFVINVFTYKGYWYSCAYKANVERELNYATLPNGLRSKVEQDVNGRATELLLQNENGENRFGTYLNYRKHGTHATNMVSSVRYGTKVGSGNYAIREGQSYKYDKAGNIAEIIESGIATVRYTYDTLGRLIREDNRDFGKTFLFSYDNNGNILSKLEAKFTVRPKDEIEQFQNIVAYDYDAVQGDRLVAFGGQTITYDQIGNPTTYLGKTLAWEKGRQLKSFGANNFTYDGSGRRIKKNSTVFTYAPNGDLVKQSDGTTPNNTLEFIYDGSGVTGFTRNDTNYVYRKNISGDIVQILDMNGNVVVDYTYDAWGRHATRARNSTGNLVSSVTGNDTTFAENMKLADVNPFRYRGYYYDRESNLYYLNSRYYDPNTMRFVNADEQFNDDEHVFGANLYAYCYNDPVNNYDPCGHCTVSNATKSGKIDCGSSTCPQSDKYDPAVIILPHRKIKSSKWNKHTNPRAGGPEKGDARRPVRRTDKPKPGKSKIEIDWARTGAYAIGTALIIVGVFELITTGSPMGVEQGARQFAY